MSALEAPPISTFRAWAHRGGAGEAPENSPTAFAHAWALGYRHLETDIRPSRDGVAVLHHDATLERTTDSRGRVRDRMWRDLRAVRLADGSAPMRLEELLEAYPGAVINLDVKESGSISAAFDAVSRANAWTRVCITSFSRRRLRRARTLGTETSADPIAVAAFRAGLARRDRPTLMRPQRLQVPLTVAGRPLLDARFIEQAHRRGLAVDAWTIDDPEVMRRLIDLGVDGIMTDHPTVLRDVLIERNLWGFTT